MTEDITVVIEEPPPEILVVLDGGDPEVVDAVVSEVGLVGPQGPPGPSDLVALEEHINSPNPHPVYDDGTSFDVIYENAKV